MAGRGGKRRTLKRRSAWRGGGREHTWQVDWPEEGLRHFAAQRFVARSITSRHATGRSNIDELRAVRGGPKLGSTNPGVDSLFAFCRKFVFSAVRG